MRALVAEDDRLGPVIVRRMAGERIEADHVTSGHDAVRRAATGDYGVIVLGCPLPDADGAAACRAIRSEAIDAPIILLSARDTVDDRIAGLDSGADDYVAKPFALRELLARMRAMTRRGPLAREQTLRSGDLTLDPARHLVHRGETPIDLSRTEFALLHALMREPGTVFSRGTLLERAWSRDTERPSNVVEVHVRYLREKIDRPFERHSLQTVRGVGYRIRGEE